MNIWVLQEDIRQAGPGIIGNPIATALGRATGSRWRVWDGRVGHEMNAPYRVVQLPPVVATIWDAHSDFSKMQPFAFELEFETPELQAVGLGTLAPIPAVIEALEAAA